MYKMFFIARNNMKKQKGDMITFFVLTLFAAFLIFDAASALLGMGHVLDDRFAATDSADMLLITQDSPEEQECAEQAFMETGKVKDYEATPAVLITSGQYRNAKKTDWDEFEFLIESSDTEKRYMTHHLDGVTLEAGSIRIPLFLQAQFPVGDILQLKIGEDVYEFRVDGYAEDPYFCSAMNISVYYVFITREDMDAMMAAHPELDEYRVLINKGVMDRNSVPEDYTLSDLEKEITDRYKELISVYSDQNPERNYLNYLSVNWDSMKGGSSFLPMILCALVMLFAVIILVVAVIIITFSIRNFIQRSMKDTGALEASGYTVRELRGALTMQIGLAALAGSVVGVLLGIATFGVFGQVISGVLGLSWNQPVNVLAAVITVAALTGLMVLDARWISRAFKKFSVLDALRGGINTHNYRKNHFSFEKSKAPVPVTMAGKDCLGNPGRNIVLMLITAILTIATLMGFGMYENFGKDTERMVEILGMEGGTIAVNGGPALGEELRKMDGVVNVLGNYGFEPTYAFGGKEQTAYTYAVDDMENTTHTAVIEGRMEKYDNEIMLTAILARDLGAKVGDVVTVSFGSRSAEYLVTGTYQQMGRMGRTGYMTFDGAGKIIPGANDIQWMVTGEEGITYEDFKIRVDGMAAEKGETWQTIDIQKQMDSSIGTMAVAMKALCIGIAVLTGLIVIFVETLIVRAKIVREWRSMGISKALGMTSRQLITQIMLSNIPAIVAGVLIGMILSQPVGGKVTVAMLSIFGIERLAFHIPAVYMILTGAAILLVALATSAVMGRRVRKINPVEMITEE